MLVVFGGTMQGYSGLPGTPETAGRRAFRRRRENHVSPTQLP